MTTEHDADRTAAPLLLLALTARDDCFRIFREPIAPGRWIAQTRRDTAQAPSASNVVERVDTDRAAALDALARAVGAHEWDAVDALARTLPTDYARGLVGALRMRAIEDERDDDGPLSRALIGAGEDIVLADYRRSVRAMAQDIVDRIGPDDIATEDDFATALHESVDGSAWIIYTARAHNVLRHSDNADAYDDAIGEPGASVEVRAFCAMEADVREAVEELGRERFGPDFELYDPDTWAPAEDDAEV